MSLICINDMNTDLNYNAIAYCVCDFVHKKLIHVFMRLTRSIKMAFGE